MKLKTILALGAFSFGFVSCNPDNGGLNPIGTGGAGNVIVANIDGQSWGADDGYAQTIPPYGLQLQGVDGQASSMTLIISPYNGIQTYQLNGITKIIYSAGGVDYSSTNGQITVNADDQYVEGSFQCQMISNTGSQSLNITNGQFKIPRQ